MARAHRRAHRVEEPRRQERAVVRKEALELAVEDIGHAVIARVAARSAVRLHQRLRRLESAPIGRYSMRRWSSGKGDSLAKDRSLASSSPKHSASAVGWPRYAEESTTRSAASLRSSPAIEATVSGTSSSLATGSAG